MNSILVNIEEHKLNNFTDQELNERSYVIFNIGNKSFKVRINPTKDGLDIFEISGNTFSINPLGANAITLS